MPHQPLEGACRQTTRCLPDVQAEDARLPPNPNPNLNPNPKPNPNPNQVSTVIVKQELTSSGRPARGGKKAKTADTQDDQTTRATAKVKKEVKVKEVKVKLKLGPKEVKVKPEGDLLHKLIQKAGTINGTNPEESIALSAVLLSRMAAAPDVPADSAPPQQKKKVGKAALISDALADPKVAELATKLDESLKNGEGLDSKVVTLTARLLESRDEVTNLKHMLSQMSKEKDEVLAALSAVAVERAKLEGQHTVLRELLAATQQSANDATGLLFDQLRSVKSPQKKKKKRVLSPNKSPTTPTSR